MYSNEEIKQADAKYFQKLSDNKTELKEALSKKHSPNISENIFMSLNEFFEFATDGDAMGWLANLYDAEIGGFYFSNSARDTDGFLPDLESTKQALGFLFSSRAATQIAPTLSKLLPPWMKDDVINFVKKMQDPENGYFYHPQWDRVESDAHPSRLGRDLEWAVNILTELESHPTYNTPNGHPGDGIRFDGVTVQSKTAKQYIAPDAPARPHLEDRKSFAAFLTEFEAKLSTNSWEIGNRFEAEAPQIAERDRQLEAAGKESGLADMLADWFTAHQNPENGAWTSRSEVSYDSTNGLLKISSTYNKLGKRFPNPALGLKTAITCITDESVPDTVCHVLNPWYAVNVISANAKRYSKSDSELREVSALREYISCNCPEMIRATTRKLSRFKIGDGSFIYKPNRKGISQGMRVAPDNVLDGDINATTIAARAIIEHIYDIIEVEMPPLYSGGDVMKFLNIIENKKKSLTK